MHLAKLGRNPSKLRVNMLRPYKKRGKGGAAAGWLECEK